MLRKNISHRLLVGKTLLIVVVFFLGSVAGFLYCHKGKLPAQPSTAEEKNIYLAFFSEVYETIKENYWEKIGDEQLANLFALGIEKLTGQPQVLKSKNKAEIESLLAKTLKQIEPEEKKKEFSTKLADIVLANLKPFGRSRLYSKKEEENLKNRVANVNPQVNQYEVLGVSKDASSEEIKKAYEEKAAKWDPAKNKSEEAKQKFAEITHAFEVLADPENRQLYDQFGVEPTITHRLIPPDIFYLHIKKLSPTTLEELKRVTEKVDKKGGPSSLILDLRDNVGGAIDSLPYFLGPFIGQDQYAYQFFHQGERIDFKTKTGWLPSLVRYKKVVVLINEGTQSSAEVIAATLKKYNVGVVVGTPTRGWGTVEKVFPLKQQLDPKEKYSVFLTHSLTLRDDGQPIEGKGVGPVININNPDWEKQLFAYFHYDKLIRATREAVEGRL